MDITKKNSQNGGLGDPAEIKEVYGSAVNIEQEGSPQERAAEASPIRYYFYRTWRSQLFNLIGYFVLLILCVVVSNYIPQTVIAGNLFSIGSTTYYLHLPLLTLIPGALLGKILINVYDAKFIIDEQGVEAHIGLVSLNLRQA